ncbi:MAG: 4Fe-4S binding protein [Planctomycetota bacterium]|nr:MAG: 4Fe-4S binding protein [Planctomycetota bacterium]
MAEGDTGMLQNIENWFSDLFSNVKLFDKALMGLEGSYVELLTILSLGLLAIVPVIVSRRRRQLWRHVNQVIGIVVFIFVVFTCLGVFGMIRNFHRGLSEIGRENIIALYYCSVPVMVLVTSMLFGPTFCGWICPTGSLQEFTGMLTRRLCRKRKKAGYPFSWVFLVLAAAVAVVFLLWMYRLSVSRVFFLEDSSIYWSEVLVILLFVLVWRMGKWDKKLRRLRLLSFIIVTTAAVMSVRITSPVHFGFAKVYDPASFLATVMVVLAALVVPRVWCRYLCPWKFAINWAAKHSVRRLEFDESKCTKCGECTDGCDTDAIEDGKIDMNECIMCLRCTDRCPENAISLEDNWRR